MKKTAQGHTGVHPRPCSPSVTQVLTTGCDSPPRFRATPEAIPGAPAGPKIELHCHRRHPGDMKRPGANSRWLSTESGKPLAASEHKKQDRRPLWEGTGWGPWQLHRQVAPGQEAQ